MEKPQTTQSDFFLLSVGQRHHRLVHHGPPPFCGAVDYIGGPFPTANWNTILHPIASVLNDASLELPGYRIYVIARAFFDEMTGIFPKLYVHLLPPDINIANGKTISHALVVQITTIDFLQSALTNLHNEKEHVGSIRCEK